LRQIQELQKEWNVLDDKEQAPRNELQGHAEILKCMRNSLDLDDAFELVEELGRRSEHKKMKR
jgi:hypothetical protein